MPVFKILASMYVTLLGTILAGIVNSIWCKTKCMKSLQIPMDAGKCLKDGNRLFGDNKTWKGFIGYIIFNIVFMVLVGVLCDVASIEQYNMFYYKTHNTFVNNCIIGLLLGLAYAVFELPNSFMKRRLGIVPGKSLKGFNKIFFIFFDQADSILGCVLVVCFYYSMSVGFYFAYVLVGAFTHIIINMLLYLFKLRKNMF